MERLKSPLVIWLIAILVYVLTFLLLWNSVYASKSRELKNVENQYKTQYARVQELREYVKDYDQIIREKDSLLALWEETQKYLPQEEIMEQWLSQITRMAVTSGIQITGFKPESPVPKELYMEYPISIDIQGGFHELGVFVSFIANSERIMSVDNLQIERLSSSGEESLETVKAKLSVICYVYNPQVAASGGAKK
ncbi:MAG TPA: type 4a pilus biogenesis protein PilO [Candidatus Hydrothermia bacterium]|nr:type 4a pilus biogenesis protein PilO [Candidatus Hydrothermae bacterium]MDD3648885.1 type 4a pilus biogenesis protein PilO [Candidatus Hydrothermia bacterium]MDD5572743.1 type 4a pilus biogenesis protein PilO [Candidatus Hydrothermia bacterium]HOK23126.1 type 4a pilus biogenesis protein PilO [Candidatus Hydrothermia bacterium]HOL23830.1 type 4a pilus biogenesis protein PilO [Candidatus Hydrothermia bacterium]